MSELFECCFVVCVIVKCHWKMTINEKIASCIIDFRGVRLAKNDFGSVFQKTAVFSAVSVSLS